MKRRLMAVVVWGVCLLLPGASRAQTEEAQVRTGGGGTLTLKGFVSTTVWAQDRSFGFGNGQFAQWPVAGDVASDPWFGDFDVRNTRLTLSLGGVEALGAKVGGGIEMDFFGGFNGAGPFSDEQPSPRLRLAHADLTWGPWLVRVGQYWSPLFGYVPESVSHIAFPLGYGNAGFVGWRFPGVFAYFTPVDGPTKVQLQVAAMRGSWVGTAGLEPADQGAEILGSRSPGNAAMVPQLEARLDLSGKGDGLAWGAFVAGHFDQKDLSGVGAEAADDGLTGLAAEVGAKVKVSRLLLQGNAYVGRAIGQQFGHITQFGDIAGWGAWGQVGFDVTKQLGVFGFYGISDPDDDDVLASGNSRLRNQQFVGMVRYDASPVVVGVEWLHARLLSGATAETTPGNQVSASLLYKF